MPRPHRSEAGAPRADAERAAVSGALLPRPHRSLHSPRRIFTKRACFRGSIAPASSKPVVTGSLALADGRFPGLYCPGLIEALGARCSRGCTHPSFRGSIAPASSKPQGRQHRRVHAVGFRGSIAPASSKPLGEFRLPLRVLGFRGSIAPASSKLGIAASLGLGHPAFPGLYCPGLIEARRAGPECASPPGRVSGALLPRPHRSPA